MDNNKYERLIPKIIANNSMNEGEDEDPMANGVRLIPRIIQENRRETQVLREETPSEQNTNANRFQNIPESA